MKLFLRLFGIWLLLGCATAAWSQTTGPKIDRVDIKFVGPASVSEQFVRANIRLKAGDIYRSNNTQDDVHALYATGQFYKINVAVDQAGNAYVVGDESSPTIDFNPPSSPWLIVGARTMIPRTMPLYSRMRRPCTSKVVEAIIADVIAMVAPVESWHRLRVQCIIRADLVPLPEPRCPA